MGFDDFFDSNYKQHRSYQADNYRDVYKRSHIPRQSYYGYNKHINIGSVLWKIKTNKKLKLFLIVAGTFLIVTLIALIIVLFPLLAKLVNYIGEHGLQGVVDNIIAFLNKIWTGTGN